MKATAAAGPAASDTIFAVASGAGRAAIAVIRVSGHESGTLLDRICGGRPAARRASLRTIRDGSGQTLDRALVLWMPGPGSFTGEDCAELHIHGGRAVVADVTAALVDAGVRPAEPGEFTRRAFANGRMDLLEAEALADLIDAETTSQREQALRQLDGALSGVMHAWTQALTSLLARQEALIDFPDEDLPAEVEAALLADGTRLVAEMRGHLDDNRRGERLRDGITIAVVGPTNAGKSSLVNVLAERDVAIVADLPGTTRDILEARLVIAGTPVTLLDTAGLRETEDPVEAEGVRRALVRADSADLVLLMVPPDGALPSATPAGARVLRVGSKADIGLPCQEVDLAVSVRTGQGIAALRAALASQVRDLAQSQGPAPLTRARHRAALREALDSLQRGLSAPLPELRGEDFRLALRALGRMTGRVGVEDILDSVFRQFCIGK